MIPRFPRSRRLLGFALIAAIWSGLLLLVGIFAMAYAIYADIKSPARSHLTAGTGLEPIAESLFNRRFLPLWQADPALAKFDSEITYVPKPGRARFGNTEFDTFVTMTSQGTRLQPPPDPGHRERVVVIGDSFAMGWGVNDTETYSAILQARYGYATTNLGVPSYGTARELLRLRRQGGANGADLLVIQFCDNDAEENAAFLADPRLFERSERAENAWKEVLAHQAQEISYRSVLSHTLAILRRRASADGLWGVIRSLRDDRLAPIGLAHRGRDLVGSARLARDFLAVWDCFPELAERPVIVTEMNPHDQTYGFIAALQALVATRRNFKVLPMQFRPGDFYRFDAHLTPAGHEAVAMQLDRAIRDWTDRPLSPRE